MSGISSNNVVLLNSSKIEGKIKVLANDVSLNQAKALVDSRKDGYDTIGGKLEGKDVLIVAKYPKGIQNSDQIQVNGKRLQLSFVENETNTKKEFFHNAIPATAFYSAFSGVVIANLKAGVHEVSNKSLLVSCLASAVVIGTGMYIAGKNINKNHDEKITNSISQ